MNKRRYINPSVIQNEQQISNNNSYKLNQMLSQKEMIFPWANAKIQNPSNLFQPYLQSVSNVFPANKLTADVCKIPFGLIITPAVEIECPVIDCNQTDIIPHCKSCSSYLCPQVRISPQGNSWICPICGNTNPIPPELIGSPILNNSTYYCPHATDIQHSNKYFNSRIELQNPVYDLIAPKSYDHIKAEPTFCFLVDISYQSFSIGFTQQLLLSIKTSLDSLHPNTRVGLITMSNMLTMFDLVNSIEIVFPDLSDLDVPYNTKNIFPQIKDCKEQLKNAIDDLLQRPINPNINGHCFASALILCEQLMTNTGGIIISGLVGLPKYGPYQLKQREVIDNDELPLLSLPTDGSGQIFRDIAIKLNRKSVSVHLFTAGQQFIDLSVIAIPSGFTCGECKHYPVYDDFSRSQMHSDIFHTLTNKYYWDSYIKLRSTTGCKMIRPHGNFTICRDDYISFPVISCDDAVTFELTATDQGINSDRIIFQFEMVYMNNEGNKMIRVFTTELPVSKDVNKICSSVDEAVLTTMMCKRACTLMIQKGPVSAIQSVQNEIQSMMNQRYFNFCSIYHLFHGILSNSTFRSRHLYGVDGRMSQIIMLRSLNIINTLLYIYPRMYSVDTKAILPLTSTSFGQGTIFLFHTVDKIYIWVSASADQLFLLNAFGCKFLENLPQTFPPSTTTPDKNSAEYLKLQSIISKCNEISGKYLPVEVIGQENPREIIFSDIIVDDSTYSGCNLANWAQNIGLMSL